MGDPVINAKARISFSMAWLLYALLVIVGGCILGYGIWDWGQATWSADLQQFFFRKGPAHFVRRIMLGLALILFPFVLSRFVTRNDLRNPGWFTTPRTKWQVAGYGMILGLGMMLVLEWLACLYDVRFWNLSYQGFPLATRIVSYALSGIVVAVLEETLVRGILLPVFTRYWGFALATLLSSALFSAAHFLLESNATIEAGLGWSGGWQLCQDMLAQFGHGPDFAVEFLTLTLMGILLCLLFRWQGSIWLGVGLHAGWVWGMRINSIVADNNNAASSTWLGSESSFSNALLSVCILTAGCAWVVLLLKRRAYDAEN